MVKKLIKRSDEAVVSGRRLEAIVVLDMVALVLLSIRSSNEIRIGTLFAVLTICLAFYNYKRLENRFLKLRAKYALLAVVMAIIGYYASYGIVRGDTVLVTSLAQALVTATSISAVFAVAMYEKISNVTILNKNILSKEILDINIRLAIYPILISVGAVFASILALIFARSNFILSVLLINLTVTAVLLTLITSVALLKEDLLRRLAS